MECKVQIHKRKHNAKHDLIDTLWNVKSRNDVWTEDTAGDLIDTLWNVKIAGFSDITLNSGWFNRYIVECKVVIDNAGFSPAAWFNRYIVECKDTSK